MRFACVQDCSRCPFFCCERKNKTVSLPEVIINSEIKKEIEEIKDLQEEAEINLPAVIDVEYEIKDAEKKRGINLWRKK